jgi:hypothetical protein
MVEYRQEIGELPNPKIEGKEFIGWFTESNEQVTEHTIVTGALACHSRWTDKDEFLNSQST